jgi:hypothetical protein
MDTKEEKQAASSEITAARGKRPINVCVTAEERDEIERLGL